MGTETPGRDVLIVDDGPLNGAAATDGDADPRAAAATHATPGCSFSDTHGPDRRRNGGSARPIRVRSGAPAGPGTLVASRSGTVR